MLNFKPINIESDDIIIHPLRTIDMLRIGSIENDIFEILSNDENIEFIPRRRIKDLEDASNKVFGIILGYQKNLSYTHFITNKITNKVIGIIDIISPDYAKKMYSLNKYDWIIEYVLHKDYWGQGIMTGIIAAICQRLRDQGINTIAAVCDKNNISSIRLLEKIGFQKMKPFDINQDYYELKLN